jgi:RAB protein geranylgeranyltransferase component A
MFKFNLNRESMQKLEKKYLDSFPDDTNEEIGFVDFNVPYTLSNEEDIRKSFDRIVMYFGGFDRAKRIFDFNGFEFPSKYPDKFA